MSSSFVVIKVIPTKLSCYLSFLTLFRGRLGFLLTKPKLAAKCSKLILVDLLFKFHLLLKLKVITHAYSFYSYYAYNFSICQLIIRDLTIKLFPYLDPNLFKESLGNLEMNFSFQKG